MKGSHSAPQTVMEETVQPVLWSLSQPVSATSLKSTATDKKTCLTKKKYAHFSAAAVSMGKQSPGLGSSKRVNLDISHFSDSKPSKLMRANSAHCKSPTRSTTGIDNGYYDHDELSNQSPKQIKVAWNKPVESSSVNEKADRTISTSLSVFENIASPADSSSPVSQDPHEYDALTFSVLEIHFPPATTPTLGLPRPSVPPESQVKRYYSLVENAISDQMVAPLSKEWIKKTHDFIPKSLKIDFKETLDMLDEVRFVDLLRQFQKH